MIEARQTPQYQSWFDGLRDREAKFGIVARPGHRVYGHLKRSSCVVLLGGGDKSSQRRDICRANALVLDP